MFANTLLESSAARQKARRWPVAAAFTLQAAGLSALLILPLFATPLLPQTLQLSCPVFSFSKPPQPVRPSQSNSGARTGSATVVAANTRGHVIDFRETPNRISDPGPDIPWTTDSSAVPTIGVGDRVGPTVVLDLPTVRKPLAISHMDEGMLLNKIIPEYPIIAIRAGVQGEVTLHAIIGRDGSIESLSVIKGHPLLINAAKDAVRQWQYRPYVLNGEPIEVETYIVVNFKKGS